MENMLFNPRQLNYIRLGNDGGNTEKLPPSSASSFLYNFIAASNLRRGFGRRNDFPLVSGNLSENNESVF